MAESELDSWCKSIGMPDIAVKLQEQVECLDDLKEASDDDIKEIIAELGLKMKDKLKFKKNVAALKPKQEPAMTLTSEDTKDEYEEEEFVIKPDMPINSGVYVVPTIKKEDISGNWKTIMVIGETGSGKSTTLNSMVNYLWNVSLDDHYRFVLVPPPSKKETQALSVTSEVTSYHLIPPRLEYGLTIVDTPGFGDTSGTETDKEIVNKIEKAFKNDLDTIDAVFFVLKASQARLTAMQRYVFNSMLRVFGKDIAENLFLLITFCDGADPPVYASVNEYGLPKKDSFELNNSAFFTGFDEYIQNDQVISLDLQKNRLQLLSPDELSKWIKPEKKNQRKTTANFWEMGMEAMENLFNKLGDTTAKSLKLSREVLQLRNHLQLRIKHLHTKITTGLNMIAEVRQIIDTIKTHAKQVNASKDFVIEVTTTENYEEKTSSNVTTCSNCKYSCHIGCSYSNNAEKRGCCAMNGDGYCTNCPGKCWWNCHVNEYYIMKQRQVKKKVTKEELKKKFDESTQGMTTSERLVISQTEEIMKLQSTVSENIRDVRYCIEQLGHIALKPCVMEEDEYYELMIASEEEQKDPGYKERVKGIKELREQAKQVRILEESLKNDSLKGQESGQLFQSALKQLHNDLEELKKIQGEAPAEASKVLQRVGDRLVTTRATFTSNTEKKVGVFGAIKSGWDKLSGAVSNALN